MKALVIDDVAMSQLIVKRTLERAGYEVLTASSGNEAFECFEEHDDLKVVVCDMMMPDISGIDLIMKVKTLDAYSTKFPVCILLTAVQDLETLQEAKRAGYVDVMIKPMEPEVLLEIINEHAGKD